MEFDWEFGEKKEQSVCTSLDQLKGDQRDKTVAKELELPNFVPCWHYLPHL